MQFSLKSVKKKNHNKIRQVKKKKKKKEEEEGRRQKNQSKSHDQCFIQFLLYQFSYTKK